MGKGKTAALLMALILAAAACGGGSGDDDGGAAGGGDRAGEASDPGAIETPTFSAEDAPAGGEGETAATEPGPGGTTPTTGGEPDPGATLTTARPGGASPRKQSVSFDDAVGDATPGVGIDEPPPWTDLAGGSLDRQGNAYRLTIRLGGAAPKTAPGSETMNIASFYDVDGDGAVDYEIWVNLGREGWGPVWYDDEGHAAPGEASNVTVVVEGDEVRLVFPDVMLRKPDRLRFSTASEYGALSAIGSSSARRDDAPDNERSVSFP